MELVYLWVEDYKNIKKQGFNFSPRFTCEFKAEYEKKMCCDEKKEKSSIKENSHPIFTKNINYKEIDLLPENINITAIVGENGSGKTAILHELLNIGDFKTIKRTKLYAYNKQTDKVEYIDFKALHKKKTQVLLFDEDVDSLSHTDAYSIDDLIGIKDRDKKNNVVIALLGYDKSQYSLENLTFIPTHVEFELTNKIEFNLLELMDLKIEKSDVLYDVNHTITITTDTIDKLNKFLRQKLSDSINYFLKRKTFQIICL